MTREQDIIMKLLRLCGAPKETWDEEDRRSLLEAREYAKEHIEGLEEQEKQED